MGGNIFPTTSRISSDDYEILKSSLTAKLKTVFQHVTVALEAPSKPDHGDIDFLVCQPLVSGGSTCSSTVAVSNPWPASLTLSVTTLLHPTQTLVSGPTLHLAHPYTPRDAHAAEQRQAQIDIRLQPTLSSHRWHAFHDAHGAAGAILGAIVRRHGMSLTDSGLWLKPWTDSPGFDEGSGTVPARNGKAKGDVPGRKRSDRVLLSAEPEAVLEFAGLDGRWFARFDSVAGLYAYLAGTWLLAGAGRGEGHKPAGVERRPIFEGFWDHVRDRRSAAEEGAVAEGGQGPAQADGDGGEALGRDAVRDKALDFFGKREEWRVLLEEMDAEERERAAEMCVKGFFDGKQVGKDTPNLIVRAMRRWVTLEQGKLVVRKEAEMKEDKQLRLRDLLETRDVRNTHVAKRQKLDQDEPGLKQEVREWLEEHWLELKTMERARVKEEKAARAAHGSTSKET